MKRRDNYLEITLEQHFEMRTSLQVLMIGVKHSWVYSAFFLETFGQGCVRDQTPDFVLN